MNILIQTDGRIEDVARFQIAKRHDAVCLSIDEEAKRSFVQIQENADDRAEPNATVQPMGVLPVVHEPRPFGVDVHAPGFRVFALTNESNCSKGLARELTEHILFRDIETSDTEGGIRLAVVTLKKKLPIVNTLAKGARTQGDAFL